MPPHGAARRPIKLCRVIARLNVGGPAVHVVQLAAGLDARHPQRFDQRLVAGREAPHEASMVPLARARGIEPIVVPELGRALSPRGDALALLKLYRIFRAWRPDIVETHTAKAGTLGRIAARAAGVPVRIHVFHGHVLRGYFGPLKTQVFLRIEQALARTATRIVALGDAQRADILGLGIGTPAQVVSISLGFDLAPFLDPPAGALRAELGIGGTTDAAPLVGILGRLAPIKRLDVFARAARRVVDGVPGAHFVVIGDGETRPEVERLAGDLGIRERVHLLGWREHRALPAILRDLDLLVNSSDNEGMPVSLIEAMAAGVPVVATAVGGTVSVVDHEVTGLLVPPGDPAALAAASVRVLREPDLGRRLAAAARAAVHPRYDLSTLVETMHRFYTSLLGGNR